MAKVAETADEREAKRVEAAEKENERLRKEREERNAKIMPKAGQALKVVKDSLGHARNETVAGIHAGKFAKGSVNAQWEAEQKAKADMLKVKPPKGNVVKK